MKIDFKKYLDNLVPVIIQDSVTHIVLMLGFMNEAAFEKTETTGKVTFFSRSKNRLWTKGETSNNYLLVNEIKVDCDNDTILIMATPQGPTCHTGNNSCFGTSNNFSIAQLEAIILDRKLNPNTNSYVASLFEKGINKIAQKVGEEAIETIIEAKDTNDELFLNEAADLLFHYLILLQAKNKKMDDVISILKSRHQKNN
jgi:phosphoribosyl-AMP cyclohydrolase / phosphoribosyl-ATP pyrophosphohydrolase